MPAWICLPWLATFSHSAFFSSTMSCLRHTLNLALSYCHTVVQCDLFCKQPLQHFHFQYLTLFFGAHHVNKPTNLGWKNSHYRSACMAARSHGGRTLVACGWLESPHTMLTGRLHFCQLWRWTWGAGDRLIFSNFMQGIWSDLPKEFFGSASFWRSIRILLENPLQIAVTCDLYTPDLGQSFVAKVLPCELSVCRKSIILQCDAIPSIPWWIFVASLNLDKEILGPSFCKQLNSSELRIVGFPAAQPAEDRNTQFASLNTILYRFT